MSKKNKINRVINFGLALILVINISVVAAEVQAAGACGTGTWTSGTFEIHHINIGQADSTLIIGPTGKSLLFDAGETNWNSSVKAQIIGPYIEGVLGCDSLDYVVISHFHLDHIGYVGYGGLWHLVENQGFTVGTTLLRDYNAYLGNVSGTFTQWKTYIEGAGQAKLNPVTAIDGSGQVDLGPGVSFNIVAHDGNGAIIPGDFHSYDSPPSENDYSIGAVLSYGDFDEWIGGDLDGMYEIGGFGYTYHDIELSVAPEAGDVDVYKVNHHASTHSSSATFVNQLDPEVSIVTVGDGNPYGHPSQSTMDLLLATSTVYLTERGDTSTNIGSAIVAGNIVIKTSDGTTYTVNSTPYTATEPPRMDMDGDGYFAGVDPDDNSSGLIPAPNGGCGPLYQICSISCQVQPGQVLINEILPAPSSGPEWVELYNTTASTINIGYCTMDDIAGGSTAYQIPAGTLIPAHGFWTLDRTSYFNNGGDDVRFLKEDAATELDKYTYGSTGHDLSWYRIMDGWTWAASPTASTTKGQSNNQSYAICDSQTQIPAAECDALVAFFNSTNGTNWTNNTGWLQTYTPCNWYGVVCNNGSNVTRLDLSSNQLNGSIPTELGNLTYLTRLSLNNNQLTGSIPTELGSLSQLVGLDLSSNQLSGSIPTEMGNLSNLTELVLSYNQLDGSIPTQLGNLTNLWYLGLANNQLIGFIPTQLGNLTNLMALYLEGNQLSGSIPTQLGNLTNLRDFRLNNNQLTGSIPMELSNLTQVEFLFLCGNLLTGSIPAELGNLINLSRLWLNNNQLSGPIPTELGNMISITDLWLNNNQLSGPIPTQLGNLTNLSRLWLNNNQLSGSMPTQLVNLTSLTQLFLSSNQLTGPIPTQLGDLTSLESLHLQDNRLSGEFPTSITNLGNLLDLEFDCWITSTDPAVISFIDALVPGWQNNICTVVLSITRDNSNPASSSSVNFTVTFSESVTGMDTGDFSLTTTGVSGAAVSGVSGTGSVYTVTVNTGIGSGTLRLDVPVSATITDLAGNPLDGLPFTSGESYTIDKPTTFADVPTDYWSWSYIERLYAAGITGGCGSSPLIYCPEATVTRGQMAVFLERGMRGSSYSPPHATGIVFGDIPISYWSATWVEKLYADGVTGGCGGGNYCPEASVTRAQMAVFLLRAKHGSSYSPPAATGDFGDVPTSYWAASWIEQLTAEGITSGCGGGNYCPEQPVSRAQMAVFLVRTFSLP